MRQSTMIAGMLFLLFQLACTTDQGQKQREIFCSYPESSPLHSHNLGVFDQQYAYGSPFRARANTKAYVLERSRRNYLRFISKEIKEDFILDVEMPKTTLEASTFGILLARDIEGEQLVAALQVIDGKLVFSPDMRAGNSNALDVKADFIRLAYINQEVAAYYTLGDDIRPIAIQQMDEETPLFVGLFAHATASRLVFGKVDLQFPNTRAVLNKN